MFELDQFTVDFERGDYVFGRCKGELPWPGKITVVYNDGYQVEFIGHKSTAVLTFDCLVIFTQETIGKVIDEYMRVSEKDVGKVKRAIKLCKTEYDKANRRRENSKKKSKNASKIKKNAENKEGTSHQVDGQSTKSSISKETSRLLTMSKRNDSKNEQSSQKLLKRYELPAPLIPEEKLEPTWSQIMALIKQNQQYEQQQQDNAMIEEQVCKSTTSSHKMITLVQEVNQLEIVVPIIEEVQEFNEVSLEVNFNQSANCTMDIEDSSWTVLDRICMIFRKMIDFLCQTRNDSLNKEEKLQLYKLLKEHQKIRYEPILLQLMVAFIHAFETANNHREDLLIEYIRVKERVETCYHLRKQLNFDQAITDILDGYSGKDLFLE